MDSEAGSKPELNPIYMSTPLGREGATSSEERVDKGRPRRTELELNPIYMSIPHGQRSCVQTRIKSNVHVNSSWSGMGNQFGRKGRQRKAKKDRTQIKSNLHVNSSWTAKLCPNPN